MWKAAYNEQEVYLKKDWIFPYGLVPKGAKILLYGAGAVGQAYYEQLQITKYCTVIAWVDQRYEYYQKAGYYVQDPKIVKNISFDYIVISVENPDTEKKIANFLLTSGISTKKVVKRWNIVKNALVKETFLNPLVSYLEKYLLRNPLFTAEAAEGLYKQLLKGAKEDYTLIIPHMVLRLTTICTLRCKGCNNLMPDFKFPGALPFETIVSGLKKFTSYTDRIVAINLCGGEPFTHPDLEKILDAVRHEEKIMDIELTTNGTIIPSERVLDTLLRVNATVVISDYGMERQKKFVDTLEKCGIRYELLKELEWCDSGNTDYRGKTTEKLVSDFEECHASRVCKVLYAGKVYSCDRAASMYELGICDDDRGYIDVNETTLTKEDIRNFFMKQYDSACNYCDLVKDWPVIKAGVQM